MIEQFGAPLARDAILFTWHRMGQVLK